MEERLNKAMERRRIQRAFEERARIRETIICEKETDLYLASVGDYNIIANYKEGTDIEEYIAELCNTLDPQSCLCILRNGTMCDSLSTDMKCFYCTSIKDYHSFKRLFINTFSPMPTEHEHSIQKNNYLFRVIHTKNHVLNLIQPWARF